jgi:hypothetical protein
MLKYILMSLETILLTVGDGRHTTRRAGGSVEKSCGNDLT